MATVSAFQAAQAFDPPPQPFHFTYHLLPATDSKPISELSNIEPRPSFLHEPIDIENDEREAIEVFINRMNQLDEQDYLCSALEQQQDQTRKMHFQYESATPELKEKHSSGRHLSGSPVLDQRMGEDTQFRHLVGEKTREIEFQLSALQIQKFELIDQLITFKQQIMSMLSRKGGEWQKLIENHIEQTQQMRLSYQSKLHELQQQLTNYAEKYEQLLSERELQGQDTSHLQKAVQELHQTNHRLNAQLEQLQCQNSELKYQLGRSGEMQQAVRQLQEEIQLLNRTIDQNSEYIFDLEQRVATENLQIAEKEANMRRQMEQQLEEHREDIEKQYKAEFERIRDDLELQLKNQMLNQYQGSLATVKQEHGREMETINRQFEEEREQLNAQLRRLQDELQQYGQKTKENSAYNSQNKNTDQFAKTIQSLNTRLREKEIELEYYKGKLTKMQLPQSSKLGSPQNKLGFPLPNKMGLPQPSRVPLAQSTSMRVAQFGRTRVPQSSNNILIDELNQSNSYAKNSAISPCSRGVASSSRDDMINNILNRIRMKQNHSILSNLNDTNLSIESGDYKRGYNSIIKPVSPESIILEKEKDLRMRNISHKLEQLRSDIRREIGMISH